MDVDYTEEYKNRCNEMCNSIWKSLPELQGYADSLPKGQNKIYLTAINKVVSLTAELYFFNAILFSELQKMRIQFQPLYKEVFGDKQITLPYNPENNETMRDAIKRYKEKEPFIDWNVRDLKEKAKETENNDE